MKKRILYILLLFVTASCTGQTKTEGTMKPLTELEKQIILYKGTEAPFTGKYTDNKAQGLYVCRQCGAPLYRSEVFYTSDAQKATAKKLVALLKAKGYNVQTAITKASAFYPAEDYHQDYYDTTGKQPYCHRYTKRF